MVVGHMDLPLDRIAEICREYRVRELSAFGSVLREDFRSDSDVDLLVDLMPNHGLGLIAYISCQNELAEVIGRRVDLVDKSTLKKFVKREILGSARVIYAA